MATVNWLSNWPYRKPTMSLMIHSELSFQFTKSRTYYFAYGNSELTFNLAIPRTYHVAYGHSELTFKPTSLRTYLVAYGHSELIFNLTIPKPDNVENCMYYSSIYDIQLNALWIYSLLFM